MFDVEDRRLSTHQPGRHRTAVVTDEKYGSPGFQQLISITAHCQRIEEMFKRLEAGNQAEALGLEILDAKDAMPNQTFHCRGSGSDRRGRWFDA